MSYQPYPTGGAAEPEPQPQRAAAPTPVLQAVKLMYAGAVASAVVIIIALVTIGATRNAIHTDFPHYSASKVHKAAVSLVIYEVVLQLITIGLWLWMSAVCKAGKSWGRIVSTVLFALNTLFFLASFTRPHAILGLIILLVVWLIGLGAIILLYQRESSAYFRASKAPR